MGYESSGLFITSVLGIKIRHKHHVRVAEAQSRLCRCSTLSRTLKFINLRAQASECSVSDTSKKQCNDEKLPIRRLNKQITSMVANMVDSQSNYCILCEPDKHPLYTCSQFKSMNHNQRVSIINQIIFV